MERAGDGEIGRVGRELGRWLGGPGGLVLHVGLFLSVATVLTLANLVVSPDRLWIWRPLAFWAVLVLLHAALAWSAPLRQAWQSDRRATDGASATATTTTQVASRSRAASGFDAGRRLLQGIRARIEPSIAGLGSLAVRLRRRFALGDGPTTASSPHGTGRSVAEHARVLRSAVASRATGLLGQPNGDGPAGGDDRAVLPVGERRADDGQMTASWPSTWPAMSATAGSESAPSGSDQRSPETDASVPPAVAALWASARAPQAVAAVAPPAQTRERTAEMAAAEGAGQDVVIRGPEMGDATSSAPAPTPVPAPDWGSLEREAAAWLTERQASVAADAARRAIPPRDNHWVAAGD